VGARRSAGVRAGSASHAGIAVGRIADERQVVGDQGWPYAELRTHAVFVDDLPRSAVDLHDPVTVDALGEVLVGRPDADLADGVVSCGKMRRGGQRIVGLQLGHRPNGDPRRS
jgi:hypothetical protein